MKMKARLKKEVFKFNKKVANSGDIVTVMDDCYGDVLKCILKNGDIVFVDILDVAVIDDCPDWEQRKWDLFVQNLSSCIEIYRTEELARRAAYDTAVRTINFYKREVIK